MRLSEKFEKLYEMSERTSIEVSKVSAVLGETKEDIKELKEDIKEVKKNQYKTEKKLAVTRTELKLKAGIFGFIGSAIPVTIALVTALIKGVF